MLNFLPENPMRNAYILFPPIDRLCRNTDLDGDFFDGVFFKKLFYFVHCLTFLFNDSTCLALVNHYFHLLSFHNKVNYIFTHLNVGFADMHREPEAALEQVIRFCPVHSFGCSPPENVKLFMCQLTPCPCFRVRHCPKRRSGVIVTADICLTFSAEAYTHGFSIIFPVNFLVLCPLREI